MTDAERTLKVGEHGVIYIIGRPIAKGVLRGKFDGKDVIVKRLELLEDCDVQELEYLRSFSHKNVVQYLYNDTDTQFLYIVLEKCDCTLAKFVKEKKHELRHLDVLWQITKGMVYLHEEKGLVHRDLNPSNVLMIFQDRRWVAKITDFDISKKLPSGRTKVTQSGIRGTGGYMAPEQIRGYKVGKSTDIFSCGLVFHHVLSEGKHPYGSDILEAEQKILSEDATPNLNSMKDEYKHEAGPLILAMISLKPEDRVCIRDVQAHHLFWNSKKKLLFFQDVSDYIIKLSKKQKMKLNVGGIADNWRQSIRIACPSVGAELDTKRYRNLGDGICDLLRIIRNWAHHYREKDPRFQGTIGSMPDGFYEFFKSLFPRLLNHIYESIKLYKGEAIFLNYYTYKEQEHLEQKPPSHDAEPSETEKAKLSADAKRESVDFNNLEQPDQKRSQDRSGADDNRKRNDSNNSEQPDQKRRKVSTDLFHLSGSFWINKNRLLAKERRVFEGVQRSNVQDTKIAIKVIRSYTKRNEREAKNLITLRPHTNVVTILHSDTFHEGQFDSIYIAMELCSTVNLEQYIKDRKSKNVPFNVKQALEHAKQVVAAIHHIHEHNILHRDLKPTSVLFSLCGKYLKICDFGLSKELKNGCSVTGLSTLKVGTDGYRAPETYIKDTISKMADIFSLALVVCYLWSYGIHPFGLDSEIWNFNIKHGKNLDLSHLRIPLSEFARNLLERMLKFESRKRLKIDRVKNDIMKLDWFATLTEKLVSIWNGDVKDHTGPDVLPVCQLYRTPELEDVIVINGSDWLFQMKTIPFVDLGSLKNLTEEQPSGYLATSSADELKKLTDRLVKNKLMAWIDITKHGGQPKVLALLYQRDYPELFGFLLPDPQILTSLVKGILSNETPSSQQPSADAGSGIDETSNLLDQIMQTKSHAVVDQIIPSTSGPMKSDAVITELDESIPDLSGLEAFQQHRAEQAAKRLTIESKQISPELIPWWIFTGAS